METHTKCSSGRCTEQETGQRDNHSEAVTSSTRTNPEPEADTYLEKCERLRILRA